MMRFDTSETLRISIVCADHFRAEHLKECLENAGVTGDSGEFTTPSDAILIDLKTCRHSLVDKVIQYAHSVDGPRPLLLGLGVRKPFDSRFDVLLSSDAALKLTPIRLQFAKRNAARSAEVELRRKSFANFGLTGREQESGLNRTILYVGEASRTFPRIKRHIDQHDYDTIAAFSTYTAFDYLHEQTFAAIILDANAESIKPDNFCAMVRRSPNLSDVPVVILADADSQITDNMQSCATDILDNTVELDHVIHQLIGMIENRGPTPPEFSAPSCEVLDPETGLFELDFFKQHLARQVGWSLDYKQPLTLLAVRVVDDTSGSESHGLKHTARVVKTLLRIQDAPVRYDDTTIVISMPGADEHGAANAARRIEGVLDATAFETANGSPSRQVLVNWRIAQYRPEQSSVQLLASALEGGPYTNSIAVA